jgi:hypothetical protein
MSHTVLKTSDPLFVQAVARLRTSKKDLEATRPPHVCSLTRCNPQGEASLYPGQPQLTCNVFLCKHGIIHLCTEDECKLYGNSPTGTCPISGFQFGRHISSFERGNEKSWNASKNEGMGNQEMKSVMMLDEDDLITTTTTTIVAVETTVVKKRKTARSIPIEDLRQRATTLINLLLYSNNRKRCNQVAHDQHLAEATMAKNIYISEMANLNQLPYWPDLYRIDAYFSSKPLPFEDLKYDEWLSHYYTHIILHVWELVQKFYVPVQQKIYDKETKEEIRPRLNFENVALGTLYIMRRGFRVNNSIDLLPQDDFLFVHLPSESQLHSFFDIKKSRLTEGDNVIARAYENAMSGKGLMLTQELIINFDALPSRKEAKVEDFERISLKRSSTGEVLFMPKSRK